VAGKCEGWLGDGPGTLAYVVVLDQFARNMFRDTPTMFAADALALNAAQQGVEKGFDKALRTHEAVFLYMPLMHAEDLAAQNRCIELFEQLAERSDERAAKQVRGNVDFAIRHRDIIARFGRFPHRNAILKRESTPEEIEFLKTPGSSF